MAGHWTRARAGGFTRRQKKIRAAGWYAAPVPRAGQRTQVVVVGGGPAGAATARALALLGVEVVVLHEEQKDHTPEVESLPASAAPLVAQLGLAEIVGNASVARMPGNTVLWAGAPRSDTMFPEPGHQIDRAVLDPQLRFAAETAGAELRTGRALEIAEDDGGVTVRTRAGGVLGAEVAVVAIGRGSVRSGARRVRPRGWRTLALVGGWTDVPPLPPARDTTTWIESGRDGWAWVVPLAGGGRQVTVMIDPPPGGLDAGERRIERLYRRTLGGLPGVAGTVEGGRLAWLRATDASASLVSPIATPRTIRVGDAASTVDPIASFGVKKALGSARLAAAVVHTALRRPATIAAAARDQYVEAEARELSGSMAGAATEAARAAAFHGGAFWSRRTFRTARARAPLPPPLLPESETTLDGCRFELAGDARVEARVVLEGWFFEERPTLVSPHWPAGLRYLGGVDVPALILAAAAGGTVAAIAERHHRLSGRPASAAEVAVALGQLVAVGAIRPR